MFTARREISEYARNWRLSEEKRGRWAAALGCVLAVAIFALVAHTVTR